MAKTFKLKFLPVARFEVGIVTFQSIEIGERQVCLICMPGSTEAEVGAFKNAWEDVVGDGIDLLVTNYVADLNTFEVTEVETSPEVDPDVPTRLERVLTDETLP